MEVQGLGLLGLVILLMILGFAKNGEAQGKPFLINCGTNSSLIVDGNKWVGDLAPGNNVTLSSPGIEASTASINGDLDYAELYRTARFFSDSLNYTVQGVAGNVFLRLHFCPFAFENYNVNESYFSVEVNGLKLVSKFNVPGEILQKNSYISGSNSSFVSLVKEYFVAVETNVVVIDFIPEKGSFGFVNAIEIIPVVDKFFVDSVSKVGGNGAKVSLSLSKRGVETMYRLNVGGSTIKPRQDSDFRRMWEDDSSYMINPDAGSEARNKSNVTYASPNDTSIAPLIVYEIARTLTNTEVMENRFNMSWKLEVDPDFDYLIRLHYCELEYGKPSQRFFKVYINNKTAADNVDIFVRAGGMNKAYHEDYFDVMPSKSKSLWVQLGPDTSTGSPGTDPILNGLEIFKLSRNNNLAYIQDYGDLEGKRKSKTMILWLGIGAGIASILVLTGLAMLVICLCKKRRSEEGDTKKSSPGWRPLFLHGSIVGSNANVKGSTGNQNPNWSLGTIRTGRRFTLADIKAATNNFDESLVIGVGGFGKVYRGDIDDGILAAIKRSNPQSQQVACARAVINPSLPKDQINLAEWAMRWQRQRSLETIIDPQLKGKYSPESLVMFGEIAEKCLADEGKARPTMGEVLWHLEYVLQNHEAWLQSNDGGDSVIDVRDPETLEEKEPENSKDSCLEENA
nr:probable receptor-like protein kinase At1g30570 [Ipomoea batatas]